MYSEIKLKEFEWYLRDFLFRSINNNKNTDLLINFKRDDYKKDICLYNEINAIYLFGLTKLVKENRVNVNDDQYFVSDDGKL